MHRDSNNMNVAASPSIVRPGVSRRDCLKAAASTLLSAPLVCGAAAAVANDDLRAKARRNLKIGVHTAPYAALPLEEAARRMKADGLSGLLTDYGFADVRFNPASPDWDAVKKINAAFDRNGLHVAAIFGYYNVVDPDAARRRRGHERMKFLLENAKRLGCVNVSTETGTLNAQSEWAGSPENATEKAYTQCRDALADLAAVAEKAGAVISIESYWQNVIDSIDRADRLFREVKSPALKLVMDPCNFLRKDQLPQMESMLEEMFRRLGDRIVVAHAKDVKAAAGDNTDLPAAGRGVLDYPLYLRLLARLDRPLDLLLEHLGLDDVARARDFVLAQFDKV
jgi:sugar phosphate isomerase/epimerase